MNSGSLERLRIIHPVFLAAWFAVARTWMHPQCPSAEERIKKPWYLDTMDCHSAIEKKELTPLVVTWMDLEGIMLSEGNQREKDKYPMILLICQILKKKKRCRYTYIHSRNRPTVINQLREFPLWLSGLRTESPCRGRTRIGGSVPLCSFS